MSNAGGGFQSGCGSGCGLICGILLAMILIPVLSVIGCGMLGGGCLFLAKSAQDAAKEAAAKTELRHSQKTEEKTRDESKSSEVVSTPTPIYTEPRLPTVPAEKELVPPPPKRPEIRTWTDTSGEYEIEAEFLSMAFGKVKLKKVNGVVVTIPLDKLSKDDQRWIKRWVR